MTARSSVYCTAPCLIQVISTVTALCMDIELGTWQVWSIVTDGWRHPSCFSGGRTHATNARAYPTRTSGWGAPFGGFHQQVWCGWRRGVDWHCGDGTPGSTHVLQIRWWSHRNCQVRCALCLLQTIQCEIYRLTCQYSPAVQTSRTCSFAKWWLMLRQQVAFGAPCSCAHCDTECFHSVYCIPP